VSRRVLFFWIAGGLICAALAAYLFFTFVELETVQEKGEMSLEAQRNPWLATERFLQRMGRKTQSIKHSVTLDSLPEGGVLVLAGGRGEGVMDEARAEKILDWVARGGYLVLEFSGWGGSIEENPLLAPFEITHDFDTVAPQDIERYERDNAIPFFEAGLPDDKQRYRLTEKYYPHIGRGEISPLWQIEDRYGNTMLHYAWDRGHVTVVSDLAFLDNDELGDFDHAEFFWALLQRYQPEGAIHLAVRMEYQKTLWQWLSATGWRLLPSAAILILLWLFWVVPRFGGVRVAPEVERRGLSEHLLALGHCLWRENALNTLRETARREIAQRLARRHPRLSRLSAAKQYEELARQSGLAFTEINAALNSITPPTPETFTRAMQTVQSLDRAL
jgi:hypothetical protein